MPDSQMDMQYIYTAGQNNGRLAQSIDNISGQTVNYTYDALNRLTAAASTGGQWGQAYAYDGFGNLKSKTVTVGSGSSWSNASSPSTNRLIGQSYDANGNAVFDGTSYDVENRLTARTMTQSPQYETYQYDPMGHRVSKTVSDGVSVTEQDLYFYDFAGRMAAMKNCTNDAPYCAAPQQYQGFDGYNNVWFGGRQVISMGNVVLTDRLGSIRWPRAISYLPYGEEQNNPTTPDDTIKFATYYRDRTVDNQDYANQRYYNPWMGRFNSADPATGSTPDDPASWNKYTYTHDDPVNRFDPSGTSDCLTWEFFLGAPLDCGDPTGSLEECANQPVYALLNPTALLPLCSAYFQGLAFAPQQAAPPPSCEDTETAYVVSYLDRYSPSSPLISYGQTIVDDSDAAGVDDRFIVALAGQESSYGTSITRGPYNAWNNLAHTANHNPYSSWNSAISGVVNLIAGGLYFGSGLNTTDSIYAKYNNSNPRTNPQFPKQLGSLNKIYLRQLGGGILANQREVDCIRLSNPG